MALVPTEPPPRAVRSADGRVLLLLNPDYGRRVNEDDLFRLPAILGRLPGRFSRLRGCPTWWGWRPEWHEGPGLVVRQYAHGGSLGRLLSANAANSVWACDFVYGGIFGALSGKWFLADRRMRNEFAVARHAHRCGVPTAVPVAVRIEKAWGPFVMGYCISELLPETFNMLQVAEGWGSHRIASGPRRTRLAEAIASAVAAMHDAGIIHADLNLKNILVRDPFGRPEAFVIDFDKARLVKQVTLRQRMANLLRLDRSVVKWTASRRAVHTADRLRFLRAYLGRYPEWAGRWEQIARRYASRHLRHRLFRQPG